MSFKVLGDIKNRFQNAGLFVGIDMDNGELGLNHALDLNRRSMFALK
jgi:hypothetical protein